MGHLATIQHRQRLCAESSATWNEMLPAQYRPTYLFLLGLTGNASLAEDLTQETSISAWTGISTFQDRAALRTWLFRIAFSKLSDSKRKLRRDLTMFEHIKIQHLDQPKTTSVLDRVIAQHRCSNLRQVIEKLEQSDRAVVVLHYFQGLTYAEMAQLLGTPEGTLKWRARRAIRRLKSLLRDKP